MTVRLKEGQSLRDLAAEHLGDPDLWARNAAPERSLGRGRHAGIELKIPVGPVASADRALAEKSLSLIQQATRRRTAVRGAVGSDRRSARRDAAVALAQGRASGMRPRASGDDARVAAEAALSSRHWRSRDATAEALPQRPRGFGRGPAGRRI